MFIWQTPAEWLMPSAEHERITRKSSAQPGDVRQPVGNPQPALPMLLPRAAGRPKAANDLAHRRDDLAESSAGNGCPPAVEQRLGIEQVEMARPAFHEQEDHVLCPRRKMRRPSRRVDGRVPANSGSSRSR